MSDSQRRMREGWAGSPLREPALKLFNNAVRQEQSQPLVMRAMAHAKTFFPNSTLTIETFDEPQRAAMKLTLFLSRVPFTDHARARFNHMASAWLQTTPEDQRLAVTFSVWYD